MNIGMWIVLGIGLVLLIYLVSRAMNQPHIVDGDETYVPTRTTASSDEQMYPFPDTNQYPMPSGPVQQAPEERAEDEYEERVTP